jgi:serine acetyltransferase
VTLFPNIRADFRAHGRRLGAQGFWVMVVYRFGRWRYGVRPWLLRKPLSGLYRLMFKLVQVMTGVEMPCEAVVGDNFVIDHFGAIIVSGYAKFGANCRIRTGVVVGRRSATTSTSARAPSCWGGSASATTSASAPTRWCCRTCRATASPSACRR